MKKFLFQCRYYLEIIALPVFVWLVIHVSGHGLVQLLEPGHEHAHHSEIGHGSADLVDQFLSPEFLSGVILLGIFVYLWHLPALKKWVPCSHDHCHGKLKLSHTLAIVALCLHFFPEAAVRHEIVYEAFHGEIEGLVGLVAFIAHFFVDVIIAVVISSYFSKKSQFGVSLAVITGVWLLAFFTAESLLVAVPATAEGFFYLTSGFLLAMFVHRPHKPVRCQRCT